MDHAITFIETELFTRQIKEICTDEEFSKLQEELIKNPEKGEVIVDTGGLRKIRMPSGNKGKSGGNRVIYLFATPEKIYFIMAYPKSKKETLKKEEKSFLKGMSRRLKEE